MAKRTSGTKAASKSVSDMVARSLPGWHLETDIGDVADMARGSKKVSAGVGVSLRDLERKFLRGPADGTVRKAAATSVAGREPLIRPIQVRPDDGGPSKTADVVDGRVKIVQG